MAKRLMSYEVVLTDNQFPKFIRLTPERLEQGITELAFEGERFVKQSFTISPSVPGDPPGVDTGALSNSIHVVDLGRFMKSIRTGVDYDIFLEFGTSRMAPRPYMSPMARYLEGRVVPTFQGFYD